MQLSPFCTTWGSSSNGTFHDGTRADHFKANFGQEHVGIYACMAYQLIGSKFIDIASALKPLRRRLAAEAPQRLKT